MDTVHLTPLAGRKARLVRLIPGVAFVSSAAMLLASLAVFSLTPSQHPAAVQGVPSARFSGGSTWGLTPSRLEPTGGSYTRIARYRAEYANESGIQAGATTLIYDRSGNLSFTVHQHVVNTTIGNIVDRDGHMSQRGLRVHVMAHETGAEYLLVPHGLSLHEPSKAHLQFWFFAQRHGSEGGEVSGFVSQPTDTDSTATFPASAEMLHAWHGLSSNLSAAYMEGQVSEVDDEAAARWRGRRADFQDGVTDLAGVVSSEVQSFKGDIDYDGRGKSAASPPPSTPPLDNSALLGKYNEEDAVLMWRLAQAAYVDDAQHTSRPNSSQIRAALRACLNDSAIGPVFVTYSSSYNVAAYVVVLTSGKIVVSIRGTVSNSAKDWLKDDADVITVKPTPSCPGCKVHRGFYNSWASISPGALTALRAARKAHPSFSVHVTGHSLGAAMAVAAVYDFYWQEGIPIAGLYTFGEPRYGNDAFFAFYATAKVWPHWRVTNYKDPVPHVPGQSLGFHHVGTEVYYSEYCATHVVCDGSSEDELCSDQWGLLQCVTHVWDHTHYFWHDVASGPACNGPDEVS